ncbi:MAG TPA: PAS domain S-box protein, partial [Actinomycetota bacterium]|nr:PAS domain S-box protein [Actinomycetota bacterium]
MSRSATDLPRFGLVGRLGVAAVIAGFLAAAIGATAIGLWASEALEGQVEETNLGVANRLAVATDDGIRSASTVLQVAATRRALYSGDRIDAVSELHNLLTNTLHFDSLVLYDADGTPAAAAASRYLARAERFPPRPDLVASLTSGGWSANLLEGTPSLELAAPLESPPGRVVGALVATLPLDAVTSRVVELRLGQTGRARLVDDEGVTLVHVDRDRVVAQERVPVGPILGGREAGSGSIGSGADETLVAVVRLSTFQGAVVVEQDRQDALRPVAQTRMQLTLILLAIVAVTVATVLLAGRSFLRPVRPLAEAVQRYGSGERVRVGSIARHDEIGTLAAHFDRMADALDERVEELEETNQRLREAQERLDDAFQDSPIGMATGPVDGTLTRANPALVAIVGRTASAVEGESILVHLHPEEVEGAARQLSSLRYGPRRALSAEWRMRRPDGSEVWTLLTATRIDDREGRPAELFWQVQDITPRKRAEQELLRLDRAKTEFVANAAHELRTPLTALSGLAEVLADRWQSMDPDQVEQSLEALVRQATRTRVLVQELLDLLRVESGSQRFDLRRVRVAPVVTQAVGSLPQLGEKVVRAEVPEELEVLADESALDRIVVSLLANAARYG